MKTPKTSQIKNHGGFTLVELLVVIAIIALLLAVLMPALNKVRKQAESVICKTNLKEISRCLSLYAYDNNQRMVTSSIYQRRWYHLLWAYYVKAGKDKYLGNKAVDSEYTCKAFYCPVEWKKFQRYRKTAAFINSSNTGEPSGYMYTHNLFFMCQYNDPAVTPSDPTDDYVSQGQAYLWFSKLDKVKQPATLPVYWDSDSDSDLGTQNGYPHTSSYTYGWDSTGNKRAPKSVQSGPSINHLKGFNYLFADMHVENRGNWPYDLKTNGPCSNSAMSWAKPGTADDYQTYFHPLRKLYINGPGSTRTSGDGFPGGLPIR